MTLTPDQYIDTLESRYLRLLTHKFQAQLNRARDPKTAAISLLEEYAPEIERLAFEMNEMSGFIRFATRCYLSGKSMDEVVQNLPTYRGQAIHYAYQKTIAWIDAAQNIITLEQLLPGISEVPIVKQALDNPDSPSHESQIKFLREIDKTGALFLLMDFPDLPPTQFIARVQDPLGLRTPEHIRFFAVLDQIKESWMLFLDDIPKLLKLIVKLATWDKCIYYLACASEIENPFAFMEDNPYQYRFLADAMKDEIAAKAKQDFRGSNEEFEPDSRAHPNEIATVATWTRSKQDFFRVFEALYQISAFGDAPKYKVIEGMAKALDLELPSNWQSDFSKGLKMSSDKTLGKVFDEMKAELLSEAKRRQELDN